MTLCFDFAFFFSFMKADPRKGTVFLGIQSSPGLNEENYDRKITENKIWRFLTKYTYDSDSHDC